MEMEPLGKNIKIIERSPFARIARWVLKSPNVAMVLGKSIHLSGVSKENFLQNTPWVAHELIHVRQFQEHGFFKFLWLYLLESMRVGYYQNKYEVEAREAGTKESYLASAQRKKPGSAV
ncbi:MULTISPECIES: hypothetical protein [Rufibacter]|uniref:DUF4157 domain-containing protein n=1 Tax=Rufibacter quisquiliarum TaxID=1549639 RepID=A0A839GVZ3_9BACT|nr:MULTISPECIES: hypothetical protein [Rufibacter]MBA9079635.1 hypothetical protein [Rufibacter quisquiliarum]